MAIMTLPKRQKAIAERISVLLERRGWTQRDLAHRTGMKDSFISRVLHAEANLTLKTIVAFEKTFGEPIISVDNSC